MKFNFFKRKAKMPSVEDFRNAIDKIGTEELNRRCNIKNLNSFDQEVIKSYAKDFFEKKYPNAKIIIGTYLMVWFKQIFETPDYKQIFGESDIHMTFAAQVVNYLFGEDLEDVLNKANSELRAKILEVKDHVPKWADDVMNQDSDLCEFVVQTIRMDGFCCSLCFDSDWFLNSPRGIRISKILSQYGGKVPETPDPKTYSKLFRKWMRRNVLIK